MEPYMELLPHAHKWLNPNKEKAFHACDIQTTWWLMSWFSLIGFIRILTDVHCVLRLGYYAWKPLVICKALSRIEPGAMLLFMDANLQKYQAAGPLQFALWRTHLYTLIIINSPCVQVSRIIARSTMQVSDNISIGIIHVYWNPCMATARIEYFKLWVSGSKQCPCQDYRKGLHDLSKTCRTLLARTDFFVPLEDAMWKRIQILGASMRRCMEHLRSIPYCFIQFPAENAWPFCLHSCSNYIS